MQTLEDPNHVQGGEGWFHLLPVSWTWLLDENLKLYGGDGIASVLLFDELLFEPRRVINVPPCKI